MFCHYFLVAGGSVVVMGRDRSKFEQADESHGPRVPNQFNRALERLEACQRPLARKFVITGVEQLQNGRFLWQTSSAGYQGLKAAIDVVYQDVKQWQSR